MTDKEIINLWRFSKRNQRQLLALAHLSERKLTEIIRLLNKHGLMRNGWGSGNAVPLKSYEYRGRIYSHSFFEELEEEVEARMPF